MAYGINGIANRVGGGSLMFPLDSDPVYSTRVRFATYNVNPVSPGNIAGMAQGFNSMLKDNIGKAKNKINDIVDGYGSRDDASSGLDELAEEVAIKKETAEKEKNNNVQKNVGGYVESLSGYSTTLDTSAPVVHMYIPLSMTFNDNIVYDTPGMGAAGAVLGQSLEAGSGVVAGLAKGLFEGATNMVDVMMNGTSGLTEASGRLALQRAVTAAASVPGVPQGLGTTASLALQTSVNPNTRALFKGVALREFTFTFSMIATSQQEATQIEEIVQHFRDHMYPEVYDPFSKSSSIPFAFNFPDVFKINFKIGNLDIKVPSIDYCYLRNCQVVYNPTGATFHADGYANEVSMTLTFMEYKTLARQDIQKGF